MLEEITTHTNPRIKAFDWVYGLIYNKYSDLIQRGTVGSDPKVIQALEIYFAYTIAKELSQLWVQYTSDINQQLDTSVQSLMRQYPNNSLLKLMFSKAKKPTDDPIFDLRNTLKEKIEKDFAYLRSDILGPEVGLIQKQTFRAQGVVTRMVMMVTVALSLYFGMGLVLPLLGLVASKEIVGATMLSALFIMTLHFAGQSLPSMYRSILNKVYYGSFLWDVHRDHLNNLNPANIEKSKMVNSMMSTFANQSANQLQLSDTWLDLFSWWTLEARHCPHAQATKLQENSLFTPDKNAKGTSRSAYLGLNKV